MISRNKVNLVEYGKIAKKCIFAAFNPTIAAAKNGEKWTLCKKLGKYYTCLKSCDKLRYIFFPLKLGDFFAVKI